MSTNISANVVEPETYAIGLVDEQGFTSRAMFSCCYAHVEKTKIHSFRTIDTKNLNANCFHLFYTVIIGTIVNNWPS